MTSFRSIRAVALPAEHGVGSLWLEPVLLAMLVAPSSAGLILGLLGLTSLLFRQPLKVVLIDLGRRRTYSRTRLASGFALLYGSVFAVSISTLFRMEQTAAILSLAPIYLIAALQLLMFDARGNSRHWMPEVMGAVAMSLFAASIGIAAGWSWESSFALAAIVAARAIPTIIYVRARLRQIKNEDGRHSSALLLHGLSLCATIILFLTGIAPVLAIVAVGMLLVRAYYNLQWASLVKPMAVGIQEVLTGLIFVALVAAGYALGL